MNTKLAVAVLASVSLATSGCATYVKTYDSDKKLLGACKTGGSLFGIPLFGTFGHGCTGSANPKDQK